MPTSEEDILKRKSDISFYTGLAFFLVFSITWALPAVFNWIFFCGGAYASFLAWYYRPRPQQSTFYEQSGDGFFQAQNDTQGVRKRVLTIVGIVFGGFFLLIIIGIFSADPDQGQTQEEVTEDVSDVQSSDASDINALTDRGNEFYDANQYDSANYYYDKVLQQDSQNAAALYNKGLILYNQSKSDESFSYFSRAYENGMRTAFLSGVLAYFHDTKNNTSRAIEFYKESLGLDSAQADVYARLAVLEPANAERYKTFETRWRK